MENKWKNDLHSKLTKKLSSKADALFKKYQDAFSTSYIDDHSADIALSDILQIEALLLNQSSEIDLYQLPSEDAQLMHLRLFQFNSGVALSDILPLFENMDLRTFDGRLYKISLKKEVIWINDFTVTYKKNINFNLDKIKPLFKDAFMHIFLGVSENDGFNKLILGGELNWREISILRAYAKYLHQTRFRFSQAYIEKTAANYVDITKDLVHLFMLRFNPKKLGKSTEIANLNNKIKASLELIISLDDDRIMRRFWHLIQATLRTNYFQTENNKPKEYISFKLKSDEVPELPLPHPLYEIFVYSPRFEGIHLRSAKVARGGIRWSDRLEDFRTEILGLMKAQTVKNVVIVPSGAKGGFVLKKISSEVSRDLLQAEGQFCYKSFIRGLLDVTDNLKNGKVIKPKDVYCYDDEDPYLVVAADKGTASFSDIANSISKEYHFWLGDAFASGGSAGYDHKKMGITARGAWESIKRHFRELNINIHETPITAIGIGDMSGDVFGNGMIYSDKIKLLAAFDHRHIFLDPNPHTEKSFKERIRLFHLPTSSWENYNPKLISKGGGVFKRSLKSIPLSAEIKRVLEIADDVLSPNELIRAILRAPVDLFFNGGIGTYVKASIESQAEVGDKTNEFCRVNGNELRCRVVGEGGNLGFTQLGRVEYALQGGLINTDFIDNSAGVDCSDHEVNIKILLDQVVAKGKLTEKKRNILLADMTDEVAKLVLKDNYKQALALSFSAIHAKKYIGLYQTYLNDLASLNIVDRVVEFLPSDQAMVDRKSAGLGLTRPEMAILLAYTKIYVKKGIIHSDLPDEPYFLYALNEEFPERLHQPYKNFIQSHSLRREIIATHLSNHIVNEMGITFVYRVQTETGATVAEIIRAHAISSKIFGSLELEKLIDSLGHKIEISLQYELLHYVRGLLNLSIRWFLRSRYIRHDIEETIKHFKTSIDQLKEHIPDMMLGKTKSYLDSLAEQFIVAGLNKDIARRIAVYRALYISLSVIDVAKEHKFDLMKTAQMYFNIGGRFNLVWFRDQISSDSSEGHWNAMARLTLRDELDILQRMITIVIMEKRKTNSIDEQIDQWVKQNHRPIARWEKLLQLLHGSEKIDYTMFFVALRELADLVRASIEQERA